MPRSAAKTRTDAGPISAGPHSPSVQPVEAVDAVPGRLTECAWSGALAHEEGEEVVGDVIAELMAGVMDRCSHVHVQKQVIPFSVWWVWNNLVESLECLFLVRDEGDGPESKPYWQEELEPQPCVIDSWAVGCVPVVYANNYKK